MLVPSPERGGAGGDGKRAGNGGLIYLLFTDSVDETKVLLTK